ncbi:MAG TPA: TetR/AcrR family transcriptional regulator [Acidimicrobiales bacterium]|nr:TetR/AcrR family transcriptional regulator [Acidimicrobiales bacterium]
MVTTGVEGPSAKASRRRPGRRGELLQAALEVIRRDGAAASMEEMAAEAGITKPVLYRYFGDREGLLSAVGERFAEVLVDRLRAAVSGHLEDSPEVVVRLAIEAYVGFIAEDPALYGFLTRQAPPGGAALVGVVDTVAGFIEELIDEGLSRRGLSTRPAATFAHGVVGMVHLAGARWARSGEVGRAELVADLASLVTYGLTGAATGVQLP